jgi:hypothetical protein
MLSQNSADLQKLLDQLPEFSTPALNASSRIEQPHIRFSSEKVADYAYQIIAEYAARTKEALHIYRPLPEAELFHASRASRRLALGSNRAAKTISAAIECARTVCDMDPHKKSPSQDGRFVAVGFHGDHIGQIMWRKLAFPDAFKMVPDEITGEWRSVRPDPTNHLVLDPIDLERKHLWKPAAPLIPPRLIADIGWEKRCENIPSIVYLTTGWELRFCSSKAAADRGTDVNALWLDEEIENPNWWTEGVRSLVDRQGWAVWSATPQAATDQLYSLHDAAQEGQDPDLVEFHFTIDNNPYILPEAKRRFFLDLTAQGPDEVAVRYYGQFAAAGLRVYPEFQPLTVHGRDPFEIPDNWTRYMAVDPGFQVCAILFAAIPPDESEVHFFAEAYIRDCTPEKFAEAVSQKMNHVMYEAFIIDDCGSRARLANTGGTIAEAYWNALKNAGIRARVPGFVTGSSDTSGRTADLKTLMKVGEDGRAKLQVHRGQCPNLEREIKRESYRKDSADKRKMNKSHTTDAAEYLAAYHPRYRKPELTAQSAYYVRFLNDKFCVIDRRTTNTVESFASEREAQDYAEEVNSSQKTAVESLKQRKKWVEQCRQRSSNNAYAGSFY